MGRYDEDYSTAPNMNRQRDLVLAVNEFCFLQSKTNGAIKTYTGPITMTISAQEALVVFNPKTKQFEETQDFNKAKQLFTSAPEGWYVVLKNPTADNNHPEAGKASNSPEICIGRKINISGPCSFSLFPGQMAKTVQGHRLRSNQYLLARVYDADAAEASRGTATIVNAEGNEVVNQAEKYFVGQLLVIKGTEISFYMPPTGIEVLPIGGHGNEYVRDAVTLERLEYAILKDEDGEKRYVHGPAVVFPKPTETFVESPKGGSIFRALELSPISGIYIKVIADYKDEKGVEHPTGEELFVTGNDQMIYYPRPEHAMIQYDGKYMHHAIAIPEGEGRYILNRLSGEIKTVVGPAMYLPDPRTEVVVKRKLTRKECELWYPGNEEVLNYNDMLSEKQMEKIARKGMTNASLDTVYSTANQLDSLAIFEANANISRGVSYTKPRTITLDTKYDGVVSINVWTGYAINVVSKTGKREIVVGPTTRLLNYDETLESMSLSTGRPKTTDNLLHTAYLRVENNKISDLVNVQTKDYVDVQIKVSYCVDFLEKYKDKWFNVENYIKYLCDRERSLLKREVKKYTIQEFYANSTDIVRNIVLNISKNADCDATDKKPERTGRLFKENGMLVHDVEVLSVMVEREVAEILGAHQEEMIRKNLELTDAETRLAVITKLAEVEKTETELNSQNELYRLELLKEKKMQAMKDEEELALQKQAMEEALALKQQELEKAKISAKEEMQKMLDTINTAEITRTKAKTDAELDRQKVLANIEAEKQKAYAESVKDIMASIEPGLIEALNAQANADMMTGLGQSIAPYAMANGESVADAIHKIVRGTTMESVLKTFSNNNK
jgi:major vault protein